MKKILFLFIFSIHVLCSYGQLTTSFGEVNQCSLDTIHLPVIISQVNDVGSINLGINWDTTKADYLEISSFHPHFLQWTGSKGHNFTGAELIFAWYAMNGNFTVDFSQGDTLFMIDYLPKTYLEIPFEWDTLTPGRCVIADGSAYLFPNLVFENDSIHLLGESVQLVSPPNNAQSQPTNLMIQWTSTPCDLSYELELSLDSTMASSSFNFTGLIDTFLNVTSLQTNTTYYWRVGRKNASGITIYSEIFEFNTNSVNTNEVATFENSVLFPNPATAHATLRFYNEIPQQQATLLVFNLLGQQIMEQSYELQHGNNNILIDVSNYSSGVYKVVLVSETGSRIVETLQVD